MRWLRISTWVSTELRSMLMATSPFLFTLPVTPVKTLVSAMALFLMET